MDIENIYLQYDSSSTYLESVDAVLSALRNSSDRKNEHLYPFLLVAGSSLESILNRAIIGWAHRSFDIQDGERLASAFCTITLKGKLETFAYLISEGKYDTNIKSKIYQTLVHLIKARNQIAHDKAWPIKVEGNNITENEDGSLSFVAPKPLQKKLRSHPRNLMYKDCIEFRDRLFELRAIIDDFSQNEVSDSELFRKASNKPLNARMPDETD